MQKIDKLIVEAENKWLKELYNYDVCLFKKTFLPSHNELHHWRTWQNAKLIIQSLSSCGYKFDHNFIEAALISIFFHDTGLTQTLVEKHGSASRKICFDYFKENKLCFKQLDSVLEAVEFHENKEYLNTNPAPDSIKTILSASDDMDAFGFIGIYRYAEIYLMRGTLIADLSSKVLQNISNRHNNIIRNYSTFPELLKKISEKYIITEDFYNNLSKNKQEKPQIIEIIKNEIVIKKQNPVTIFSNFLEIIENEKVKNILRNIQIEFAEPFELNI